MKKRIFVAIAMMAGMTMFAQQKKTNQPPPPPPPPVIDVKEVPPPPPPPPKPELNSNKNFSKEYSAFLKRNPSVKGISRSENKIRIYLKTGKEEVYNMNNEEEMQQLKNKYGELPTPPPPPPPPPPKLIKEKTVS